MAEEECRKLKGMRNSNGSLDGADYKYSLSVMLRSGEGLLRLENLSLFIFLHNDKCGCK